jgi:hypothetical protein
MTQSAVQRLNVQAPVRSVTTAGIIYQPAWCGRVRVTHGGRAKKGARRQPAGVPSGRLVLGLAAPSPLLKEASKSSRGVRWRRPARLQVVLGDDGARGEIGAAAAAVQINKLTGPSCGPVTRVPSASDRQQASRAAPAAAGCRAGNAPGAARPIRGAGNVGAR